MNINRIDLFKKGQQLWPFRIYAKKVNFLFSNFHQRLLSKNVAYIQNFRKIFWIFGLHKKSGKIFSNFVYKPNFWAQSLWLKFQRIDDVSWIAKHRD